MKQAHRLPIVGVRDLVRNPAKVLERVARGERFIVCRHRQPVATLQPINGWVVNMDGEAERDIYGSPLGDPRHEAAKLSSYQMELLCRTDQFQRFRFRPGDWRGALADLELRGLAQKSHRGVILTGRGMVMREWLLSSEAERKWKERSEALGP